MNYHVKQMDKQSWAGLSEYAHSVCFEEVKPTENDRIDYALVCYDDDSKPMSYVTCREFDSETVYWQFGGAFPETKGTIKSYKSYMAMTAWTSERYKRITTLIENDNIVMLKFAMKIGYKIIGTRNFKGSVLLEHLLEFDQGE